MPPAPETLSAKIYRYDPAVDEAPRYETVTVPFEKDMRVLDVLDSAVESCGLSVGYRYFCGVKRCGMCGVNVDGKPVLACWEEARPSMVIEPLSKMAVIRDLAVDRSSFEGATVDMNPCLVRNTPYETFPEPLTHIDVREAFPLMNCIECHVCTAACPAVLDEGPRNFVHHDFVGPGALVQIAKVALHPKDELDRSGILENASVDLCMSCGRCEEVCPNGIPVLTGAILPLRAIAVHGPKQRATFPVKFAENVRRNVDINSATLFLKTKGWSRTLASLPMLFKMIVHRKTNVLAKVNSTAQQAIEAIFKEASRQEKN